MVSKRKAPPFPAVAGVSPAGIAGYAKFLYELDTGNPAYKPKYNITLALDPSDPVAKAWIDERIERHLKCTGNDMDKCPVQKGDAQYKQDPALMYVRFKSARRPAIVDTDKNDITHSEVRVFGGDTIRIAYKDNPSNSGIKGCFLYVNRVQLITSNQTPDVDFDDDVKGFVASEAQRASSHEPTEGGAEEGQTDDDGDF